MPTVSVPVLEYYRGRSRQPGYVPGYNPTRFPLNGLVSYWACDEASGTNVADTGGVGGAPGTATGTTIVAGKLGNCRDYNESTYTEYVSMGNVASLNLTVAVSLACWIKISAHNNYGGIAGIGEDAGANSAYQFYFDGANNTVSWFVYTVGASSTCTTYANVAGDGNWHHIVGTYDKNAPFNQMQVYVDGVINRMATLTGSIHVSADPFMIGRYNTAGRFVRGLIDEVGVWSRALTPNEVAYLYNSGNGQPRP